MPEMEDVASKDIGNLADLEGMEDESDSDQTSDNFSDESSAAEESVAETEDDEIDNDSDSQMDHTEIERNFQETIKRCYDNYMS